jgi:hypothetical protein
VRLERCALILQLCELLQQPLFLRFPPSLRSPLLTEQRFTAGVGLRSVALGASQHCRLLTSSSTAAALFVIAGTDHSGVLLLRCGLNFWCRWH